MKRVHLFRVDQDPRYFDALLGALAQAGLRCGWLDWQPGDSPSTTPGNRAERPPAMSRTVSVGPGSVSSNKPIYGPPVLRDVVREHFLGCVAVLVRGPVETISWQLEARAPEGDSGNGSSAAYAVVSEALHLPVEAMDLARRLRRPRPFVDLGLG